MDVASDETFHERELLMKRCLSCDLRYPSGEDACPSCGFRPARLGGFDSYAPEFSQSGGGFKVNYFAELARLEDTSFWFRSRNKIILWALNKYSHEFRSFLEIGCGTGYVLSGVAAKYPDANLYGSEIFVAGLGFAASRLASVNLVQMDARNIPYENEFDVIGAFDVIEHIREDEMVLQQAQSALKSGGVLLLTVPQHTWLWSAADEYACHERRYIATDLHTKIKAAGFEILRSTSFVTSLLPAMMLSRWRNRNAKVEGFDPTAEFRIPAFVNTAFERFMDGEAALIRAGVSFPVGGSRLVVAKKI